MKRLIPFIASIVIVGIMVAYVTTQDDLIAALGNVSLLQIALLLLLSFAGLLAQTEQFRAALTVTDTEMGMVEATGLTAVNTMANYYIPAGGGPVVRGVYMNAVHDMAASAYVVLTVATVATGLGVAAIAGLAASIALSFTDADVGWEVFAAFAGVVVLLGAAMLFALAGGRIFARFDRISRFVGQLAVVVALWRSKPRAAVLLVVWTTVVLVTQATRLFVAFDAVGAPVDVLEMVLIGSLVSISFVISLTPGNLGIKEGVTVVAAAIVGVEANVALIASLVDRGAALIVTFIIGLIALPFLVKRAAATKS
ncbi:MAG: flippase-like domain-containing protein [Acidimicrobiia bacterium]|nr:flippase-like domain-containing protein [Acidimicrobiia bacterium]